MEIRREARATLPLEELVIGKMGRELAEKLSGRRTAEPKVHQIVVHGMAMGEYYLVTFSYSELLYRFTAVEPFAQYEFIERIDRLLQEENLETVDVVIRWTSGFDPNTKTIRAKKRGSRTIDLQVV